MADGRVFVVGSVNVDRTVTVGRLPLPGETVLGHELRIGGGGKGANAAVAAARAGASVVLVGAVGADGDGDAAVAELRTDRIDVDAVARIADEPTGCALIVVREDDGENQITVAPGANLALSPAHVTEALGRCLTHVDVVLVSCEIPDDAARQALACARSIGAVSILNPAPARPDLLASVDRVGVLTPNGGEAAVLTGERDPVRAALVLERSCDLAAIVTLGAEGCVVASHGTCRTVPGVRAGPAVDTTGAGDVFNGVLAASLARRRSLEEAVGDATAAAGVAVSQPGARPSLAGLARGAPAGR